MIPFSECGVPQIHEFQKRIIGGNEAHFGEFPWQAHIRISGYQCGGVLVSKQFVATAAHCIHKYIIINFSQTFGNSTMMYFAGQD